MQCPACHHDNPDSQKFCGECGTRLKAVVLPEHRAAPASYTPAHLAQKILTSRSALEGERKQVTVLFCDMTDSTRLAARLGAESMHQLLNDFFEVALGEVHRYDGTVNQFLGDGFMALFGAPVAHEDHARRALLAALGLQQRLREAPDGTSLKLVHVRIGINTGAVVVGKIGDNLRMDYTAVGDTTNLAARIQQQTAPGSICVSEATQAAALSYFEFRSLGTRTLKGIAQPTAIFELDKARGSRVAHEEAVWIGSPLVGREHELSALWSSIERLLSGQGGTVVLEAEPGLGKSRLVSEIRRRVSGEHLLWLEGRGLSFGHSLSYWPFIEVLKRCFSVQEDDSDAQIWSKVREVVESLFANQTEEVLPYLATVLALRLPESLEERVKYLDGQALGRQIFRCMRQLFEQLAQRQPVVLVLEDWHWADLSSVGLAEHLVPLVRTAPLLIWFVTRPESHSRNAQIRQVTSEQDVAGHLELRLAPLAATDSVDLLDKLTGGADLSEPVRQQILNKTDGNPFFIEEVIRSLVSEGALTRAIGSGSLRLVKPLEQLVLPDTIEGLILARIDRLHEDVKQALKLAAVIGRSFFRRVLQAIAEAGRELDGKLVELEQVELIRQRQLAPEVEYIFKHALVQEAAYNTILAERRRVIHRKVGGAIETLFPNRLDEFVSLLAYHYARAEDWEKAQEYLFKAGDQARRMAGDAEALEHYRQAQAAYVLVFGDKLTPIQRGSLDRKIGEAQYGIGNHPQALESFERALLHLGYRYPNSRAGVRGGILRLLAAHALRQVKKRFGIVSPYSLDIEVAKEVSTVCQRMVWVDYFIDDERMLLECLLELDAGERSGYELARALGLSNLGVVFTLFGCQKLGRRYHLEALAVAANTKQPSAIGFAHFAVAWLDAALGQWDEMTRHFQHAAVAYRECGDVRGWGGAKGILAVYTLLQGDLPGVRALCKEMLNAGQDAGDPQIQVWAICGFGMAALAAGSLDEAAAHLRKSEALAVSVSSLRGQVMAAGILSKCQVRQGRLDGALESVAKVTRIIRARRLRGFDSADALNGAVETYLAVSERLENGERREALRKARRACRVALRSAREVIGWMPEAMRLSGTLAWISGDARSARSRWEESLALARKLDLRIESAQTLLEMGGRLQDGGMIEQAIREFCEAGAKVGLAFARHARARNDAQSTAKTASALKHYEEAITALTEVKAEYKLAAACLECSCLHKQLGQIEQARTKLTAALGIFKILGAGAEENTVRQELARLSSPARSAQ